MDTETKGKLTELQHQHELLKEKVEGSMETMEANNRAALAKNESAIDRLRTDMERLRTGIFIQMVAVVGAGVAILAFILKQ